MSDLLIARYNLFVLELPLNTNQPTNQPTNSHMFVTGYIWLVSVSAVKLILGFCIDAACFAMVTVGLSGFTAVQCH